MATPSYPLSCLSSHWTFFSAFCRGSRLNCGFVTSASETLTSGLIDQLLLIEA
jgi:hypothetical protein